MVRILLSLIACVGCFAVAFSVRRYAQAWVLLGGAMFWVLGGNVTIWYFGDFGNHWVRWSPFYGLVIAAWVKALWDNKQCQKKARR